MKVCFETFGCRLNRAEALEEEAKYLAAGWTVTKRHSDANRFVIRGCSVTAHAQRDCERLVAHLRRKYPNTRIIIQGCFEDKSAAGNNPFGAKRNATLTSSDNLQPKAQGAVPTRTARGYLKVQDGCSGKCAFCIVPKFRGKSVSTDFDEVLAKAMRFIDAGYREIVITGCNLSLYASRGKRLPDLLAALAKLGEGAVKCRFRHGSVEPGECAASVIRVMADHPNICRFLHLTVQSASDRILFGMHRPYRAKEAADNCTLATELMPDVALGCDLMTGFPGESDIDFLSTKAFLQRIPFSNVHVFPYSERPGTAAAALRCRIPREIRKQRAKELIGIAKHKRKDFAARFIGKKVEVLVEDEEKQAGWTSEYLWYEPRFVAESLRVARKSLVTVTPSTYDRGKLR